MLLLLGATALAAPTVFLSSDSPVVDAGDAERVQARIPDARVTPALDLYQQGRALGDSDDLDDLLEDADAKTERYASRTDTRLADALAKLVDDVGFVDTERDRAVAVELLARTALAARVVEEPEAPYLTEHGEPYLARAAALAVVDRGLIDVLEGEAREAVQAYVHRVGTGQTQPLRFGLDTGDGFSPTAFAAELELVVNGLAVPVAHPAGRVVTWGSVADVQLLREAGPGPSFRVTTEDEPGSLLIRAHEAVGEQLASLQPGRAMSVRAPLSDWLAAYARLQPDDELYVARAGDEVSAWKWTPSRRQLVPVP